MFTAINYLKEKKPGDEKPRKETCSEIVKGYILINIIHIILHIANCKIKN